MPRSRVTLAFALCLVLAGWALGPGAVPRVASAEPAAGEIPWITRLADAFSAAADQDKPLMICINSRIVDSGRREPAAKELRENTYPDARVVKAAQSFVCAFLTQEGSAEDFGELRMRFGIDGEIVSPQHIFTYPDGRLIDRKEYWPYGRGDSSVNALLGMMEAALEKDRARRMGGEVPAPDTPDAGAPAEDLPPITVPEGAEERAAWIAKQLEIVGEGGPMERREALRALLVADDAEQEHDCVTPLLALLDDLKRDDVERKVDIVRALGKPGLEIAAKPLTEFLSDRDPTLRGNAAVSLEYIGSDEAVSKLMRAAPKEDVEIIANHMFRALGRCGAGDSRVRSLLLKKVVGASSTSASYGPIIGLAYFEEDPKTAKEVQKLIEKMGIGGGGRRGGWRGASRRGLLVWCLTETGFGDPKSAEFIREKMIPAIGENEWADAIHGYYEAAARVCDGDAEAKPDVEAGASRAISGRWAGGSISDESRTGRDTSEFEPKAEWSSGS